MTEQRVRDEANERQRMLDELSKAKHALEMADIKRTHEENVRQLEEKMANGQKLFQEEIRSMQQDQERYREQGFAKQAEEMGNKISSLEEESKNKPGLIRSLASGVKSLGSGVLKFLW